MPAFQVTLSPSKLYREVLLCVQKKETRVSSLKTGALVSSRWTKQGLIQQKFTVIRRKCGKLSFKLLIPSEVPVCMWKSSLIKGTVSRDGYYFGRSKHFTEYFLCMRWLWGFQKLFTTLYIIQLLTFYLLLWNYFLILEILTETLLRISFSVNGRCSLVPASLKGYWKDFQS